MLVQVRRENTRHILGDVTSDATFLFGHTAAVNDTAASGARSCDTANF
jgi:hypothetical protein